MKKITKLSLIALLGFGLFACGDNTSSASSANSNQPESSQSSSSATSSSSSSSAASSSSSSSSSSVEKVYNYGTLEAPLSVSEALALAIEQCVNNNDVTKQIVYAKGFVLTQPDYSESYIKDFKLADSMEGTKSVLVYSTSKSQTISCPDQNDEIIISGYIKNYNNTIEFATANNVYVNLLANTRGTSTVTATGENCTVTGLPESGLNGTTFNFTVAPATGYQIDKVTVNGKEVVATEGTYTGTIAGNTIVKVTTSAEGTVKPTLAATLTFDDTANRTECSNTKQVWTKNNITLTNEKNNATSNVVADFNPVKCYKGSSIKIEYTSPMTMIVLKCTSGYVFKNTVEGCTITTDGNDVTITLETESSIFEVSTLDNQVRLKSIEVYTIKAKKD